MLLVNVSRVYMYSRTVYVFSLVKYVQNRQFD